MAPLGITIIVNDGTEIATRPYIYFIERRSCKLYR